MKKFRVQSHIAGAACFLAAICLPCFADGTNFAGDNPPAKWMDLAIVKQEPAHEIYLGGSRILSYASKDQNSAQAHWVIWGKFVYKEPQKFKDKLVSTELFAVHIDCAKGTFSLFRNIKLDDKDQVIDDSKLVTKFQPLPNEFDTLGSLAPAESVAEGAQSFTCGADAE